MYLCVFVSVSEDVGKGVCLFEVCSKLELSVKEGTHCSSVLWGWTVNQCSVKE